jgi:hypothetical protein
VGFELAVSAGKQPQTHTLDRAVTGIGTSVLLNAINLHNFCVDISNVAFFTAVTLKMALQGPKNYIKIYAEEIGYHVKGKGEVRPKTYLEGPEGD